MSEAKTALVTGGAKRVGRAVVERLAEAGFDVAFTYHHSEREANDLARDLAGARRRAVCERFDLADDDAAGAVADWVRSRFGRLDVLVNCASCYLPDDGPAGASPRLHRRLLAVNAVTPSCLMASLAPDLAATHGCVVNFLDLLAEKPWPKYSAYCASKAALQSLTLGYARRLAPHVRVNGIAPGVVDWPDDMPQADRAAYLKRVPLGRAGTPREAADVVHWLATDASYVTGQVIRLDGGRSLA